MKRISTMILAVVLGPWAACSSGDGGATPDPMTPGSSTQDLTPPAVGQGTQLRMVSVLDKGVETERCKFFQVPPEGWYVNRQDIRYTPGSHHVLLFMTTYTAIPTVDIHGVTVDTSGVFPCPEGAPADWSVGGVAGGAQKANGEPAVQGLPEDTALVLPGNSVLLMNTHYLNASPGALDTDARINLYFTAKEKVKREAGILFFYNPFIYVPAGSMAVARRSCPVLTDINLVNSQSHMHKRGVDYFANLLGADGQMVKELYRGTDWQEVLMKQYPGTGESLKAGQSIEYQCGYNNKETPGRTIIQGLTTKDEMCMFLGLYYPRDPQTEMCALMSNKIAATRYLGGGWVGSGLVDGVTTGACITSSGGSHQPGALYKCVTDSCPKISVPMSKLLQCLGSNNFGQCDGCQGEACTSCLGVGCRDAIKNLSTASCN
jgi:hypothetical protein